MGGGARMDAKLGTDLEVGDGLTFDEVFLDDAFEVFGGAGMIPNGIGVNDGDGSLGADAEAIGLGAVDEGVGAAEFEFGEAGFEELPSGEADFRRAAFGLGGGGAEEDVPLVAAEIEGLSGFGEEIRHEIRRKRLAALARSGGRGVGFKVLANRGGDRLGHGLPDREVGLFTKKPRGNDRVVHEFDFEEHDHRLEEVRVLAGVSEGAHPVLQISSVAYAVADGFGFRRVTTERLKGGGHLFDNEIAEGEVAVVVGVDEVEVFPIGVVFGANQAEGAVGGFARGGIKMNAEEDAGGVFNRHGGPPKGTEVFVDRASEDGADFEFLGARVLFESFGDGDGVGEVEVFFEGPFRGVRVVP